MLRIAVLVAVAISVLWCVQSENGHAENNLTSVSDLEWNPDARLDQVAEQLEDILVFEAMSQQSMNYASANLASVLDAKLYILFVRYLELCQPEERNAILESQNTWLESRSESARMAAAEGGTIAPFNASSQFAALTRVRIAHYQSLLSSDLDDQP